MKSIVVRTRWVSWFLLAMGAFFLAIGLMAYLLASGFENPADEQIFRYTFLGVFGGIGIVLMLIGLILGCQMQKKKAMADRLVASGHFVWADAVDVSINMNMRINHQSPCVLRCALRHTDGQTYLLRSPYLRFDPRAFLTDGKVKVWLDPYDIKQYYVDVDGSMNTDIIEL